MYDMNRRLKKAEKKLNLSEKPITATIVNFGGALPPDRTDGNMTIHHVVYEDIEKR